MEKELAKRSHFCQKVIKKLKKQADDLEHERDQLPKPSALLDGADDTRNTNKEDGRMNGNGGQDEEMINFLELKLEQIEKQLKYTQNQYE